MAKTLFGPGVIVTSKWLNGARKLFFDGLDEDWHFNPINSEDILRVGEGGLDEVYVTRQTHQEIESSKTFQGPVKFGTPNYSNSQNAPTSASTNKLFESERTQRSFAARFAKLKDDHLITKKILTESLTNLLSLDGGVFNEE